MTTVPTVQHATEPAPDARSPLPDYRAVLREQLRTTGFVLRLPMLVGAALGLAAAIVAGSQAVTRHVALELHAEPVALPGIVGALLPVVLWAWEDRYGPGFFWTLPVDRSRHALIKVLAGWLWLMGGVAAFSLALLCLALVSGGRVLPVETLRVLAAAGADGGPVDPAAVRLVDWAPGPLIWLVPFTAATATYLLASAVMVGLRHPLRWGIGLVLSFGLLSAASDAARALVSAAWPEDAPARAVTPLIVGRYGLDAVLTARTQVLFHHVMIESGERVAVWSALPNLADWGIASLLWIGAGLLALLAAASRHRERRRP